MLPELRYELLFFYTRDDLERLQPLSQSLLDMIVKGANVLPLRPIHLVDMDTPYYTDDIIKIFVEHADEPDEPDYEASVHDGDFAETFRRLQHACFKNFYVGIFDSPFMRYWKAQETACFTAVNTELDLPEPTDYDVLDSVVNHLRPRLTHFHGSEYLELTARESFLNNLQTCEVNGWGDAFPPPSFFLSEPGYTNYKLWGSGVSVANGIDGFIESFVREGCANTKLEFVCITWIDLKNQQPATPKQLREPSKTDVALPKSDTATALTRDFGPVPPCELHSFVNLKQWLRMDIYKWTSEDPEVTRHHTRHLLLCRVMDI